MVKAARHAGWTEAEIARVAAHFTPKAPVRLTQAKADELHASLAGAVHDNGGTASRVPATIGAQPLLAETLVCESECVLMNFPVDEGHLGGVGKGVAYRSKS